jgi:hypothetical protein
VVGFVVFILLYFLKWKSYLGLWLKTLHKYVAYAIILLGEAALITGTDGYSKDYTGVYSVLEPIHICIFFGVWFCFEVWFQIWKRKETPFNETDRIITLEEY